MRSSLKFVLFVLLTVILFRVGEVFPFDRYQQYADGLQDSIPKLPGNAKMKEHYLSPKLNYVRSDFSDSFKEKATLESRLQSLVSFGLDYSWIHPRTRKRLLWAESNISFHGLNDQMSNAKTDVPPSWNVELAPINIRLLWPYVYLSGEYERVSFLSFDKEKHILVVADSNDFKIKKVDIAWLNAGVFLSLIPNYITVDLYSGKTLYGRSSLASLDEKQKVSGWKTGARFRQVLYRDGLWYSVQFSRMSLKDSYGLKASTLSVSLGHIF